MPQGPLEIQLKVMDNVDAMLGYWDKDLRCRFANAAYKVWFGKSRKEVVGISMKDLLGPLFELNLPHVRAVLKGEVQVFERDIPLPDGSMRHSLASYYPDVLDGKVVGFSVQVADVTRMKELELELQAAKAKAEMLATHDFLTGLPNRVLLADTISQAIGRAGRTGMLVGITVIDIDGFKEINDTFGHETGDEYLKEIARRLNSVVRITDTVARLGGDEFIFIACECRTIEDLELAMKRLVDALSPRWVYGQADLNPSVSCGVAVFPAHGANMTQLLVAADAAMYQAKRQGKSAKGAGGNKVRFFTDEMNAQATEHLTVEKNLRRALDAQEFFLVYQPQIEIKTGRITGFEALIRWQHPKMGLVPPDGFVSIAENNGLILPIDEWVLRTACTDARRWQDNGLPAVPVAVNVSAVQFRQDGFTNLIRSVLKDTGLSPQYLELELTESLLLSNANVVFETLQDLNRMGVLLAIDDFGTGYSSLSYLKHFPVCKLKIDRSFVREIVVDCDDAAITAAIISMAKSLHLKVIAEGVEDEAQLSLLREQGCDEAQGFYFSKGVQAAVAASMLGRGPVG
jgi:diguanylate cyclase (GGDEF)-like protein/PAS domain S-box-containing protein